MTRGRSSLCCRPTSRTPRSRPWPVGCASAGERLYLVLTHRYAGDDARRLADLADLARDTGLRPLATNDVHYHHPDRRPLQDVVTCIREHARIAEAAPLLFANAERHLKPPDGDGAAVQGLPAGAGEQPRDPGALPLLARRARLRLPGAGQLRRPHAGRGAGAAHLGRGRPGATPAICRPRSSTSYATSSS